MKKQYAKHASEAFNRRLHKKLEDLSADVEQALNGNLVALILGGGYGRGEGGVVCHNGEAQPYNDLDLTPVVRRKRAVGGALLEVAAAYEKEMGIEVDFARPLTVRDIRHWQNRLMWFDLLHGHVVLCGPQEVLEAHAPKALQQPPPPIEGTRLLLNRGAGLLWTMRVVGGLETAPDADFVRRNYYKCWLALGDALLIAYGRFATPYAGRDRLLSKLAVEAPAVARLDLEAGYEKALQFKFLPDSVCGNTPDEKALETLAGHWGRVYLHVEGLRTQNTWPSLAAYVNWQNVREPSENRWYQWPRNFVLNRRLGLRSVRYPRERLYRRLPGLLNLTGRPASDWAAETAGFLKVWKRFN